MDAVTATALSGSPTELDGAAIAELGTRLSGEVITPAHGQFHETRKIWNAMIDRSPGLIVRCKTEQDVVEAVRFAAAHKLLTSIRGGGHNVAGNALCDGGLMID